MSTVLDQLSDVTELVHRDLVRPGTKPHKGRRGMSAEQVLRTLIVKLMNGRGYEQLSFHLADSNCYRWLCRLGVGDTTPDRSTLQEADECSTRRRCNPCAPCLLTRCVAPRHTSASRSQTVMTLSEDSRLIPNVQAKMTPAGCC